MTLNTVHTAELYFAYAATRWHQSAGTLWVSSVIPILILMWPNTHTRTGTHTYTFNGPVSGTTRASQYQKGKTNLNFTEARDSEWQWHQLGRMQVCTSLQTDNHASIPSLKFFTGWVPFLSPNQHRQSTEGLPIHTIEVCSFTLTRDWGQQIWISPFQRHVVIGRLTCISDSGFID